jgi:hypothetical protein
VVPLAGIHQYEKSLLEFTESTSNSQSPAPSSKFGVWCALSARRIVVPVVVNQTIGCEKYVQVILGQFFPELTEEERLCRWFQ